MKLFNISIFTESLHDLCRIFNFPDYYIPERGSRRSNRGADFLNERRTKMNDIKKNSTAGLGAVPVQTSHKKRFFLKGMAITFLAFAPFLGICDLLEGVNPLWAAKRGDPMGNAKNSITAKAQKATMDPTGSGKTETATFAGGCFWCTEADFEKLPGVVKVFPAIRGGRSKIRPIEEVSSGRPGMSRRFRFIMTRPKSPIRNCSISFGGI